MTKTVRIALQGLTCDGCVSSLTTAFMTNPAVESVTVTREPSQATVTYNSAETTPEALCSLVDDAGFEGTVSES
ncbi:heavy-metal-associated domain-containing protein [Saccharibacter floricola]|uniref:Cation/copper resistance transporter ATPase CopZ n=1 Tax=Saccharibacter floricola DSM 15669 TaxID=1123227 RepID=A0ABQ0NX83_9PROT|nr:heavy metal-associated domain-containing protein [Saccharibacter floricola]GBQ05130.1 cation/copper resistance transporter ATPase CopZ [Saccharibacter floricola DSM 15669]